MSKLFQQVGRRDHVVGSEDARVTLVEYGDYECPACGRAHGVLAEVLPRAGDTVVLADRHFPLSSIHPHALLAAQAAEAAAAQDRFWEMHHALYEHQDALEPDDLLGYAEAIGLDAVRFAQELREELYLPRVRADLQSGERSAVSGTPTFFINGECFELPWDDPMTLTTAIEEAA